jgi:hypothetical protein
VILLDIVTGKLGESIAANNIGDSEDDLDVHLRKVAIKFVLHNIESTPNQLFGLFRDSLADDSE